MWTRIPEAKGRFSLLRTSWIPSSLNHFPTLQFPSLKWWTRPTWGQFQASVPSSSIMRFVLAFILFWSDIGEDKSLTEGDLGKVIWSRWGMDGGRERERQQRLREKERVCWIKENRRGDTHKFIFFIKQLHFSNFLILIIGFIFTTCHTSRKWMSFSKHNLYSLVPPIHLLAHFDRS